MASEGGFDLISRGRGEGGEDPALRPIPSLAHRARGILAAAAGSFFAVASGAESAGGGSVDLRLLLSPPARNPRAPGWAVWGWGALDERLRGRRRDETGTNMEIAVGEAASLETDLLQLNEVSPLALKSNSDFVEKIFQQWLALPDSNRLVSVMLN
ncbi:hypothetical protein NL676_001807 [Syzygium grande]|nr:hypothetical protein NL676_001807 [Syzygium grande]